MKSDNKFFDQVMQLLWDTKYNRLSNGLTYVPTKIKRIRIILDRER